MNTNKRAITIDNGGSELRAICNSNNDKQVICMDKNITILSDGEPRIKESVEPFDIINITKAPNSDFTGVYCVGSAYYMYGGVDISMDNQRHKAECSAWYQQIILAIAQDAMRALLKANEELGDGEEGGHTIAMPYDYTLVTLLPVSEHSGATDYVQKIKAELDGFYHARFPALNGECNEVSFNLYRDRIGVLPEGVVCMTHMSDIVTPNDYTLILDVGHVSSDLSICRGTRLMGSSVITSPFAGGTIVKLIGGISAAHNVLSTTDMCVETLKTGKLAIGSKSLDINDELTTIKKTFVRNYLKNEVLREIEMSGITAANIRYVVPIGAVLGTQNPKTGERDILQMIIDECSLDNAEVRMFDEDLRYVNIKAAANFCDAFSART